jgi:methyl-accepting chemotaxis protein
MQWFNQLRVTTRLIAGFLVVSVIGAIIGLLGVVNMGRMAEWTGKIYNSDLQALKAVRTATSTWSMPAARRSRCCPRRPWASAPPSGSRSRSRWHAGGPPQVAKSSFTQPEGQALFKQYETLLPPFRERMQKYVELVGKQPLDTSQFESTVFTESAELLKDSRALEDCCSRW